VTSLARTKTLSVDSEELTLHRDTVDTDQLAGTTTTAPYTDDSWTALRSEDVAETSEGTVDAVQVHAMSEHRRHHLAVLRRAPTTSDYCL